jgi:hypothetical protein
MQQQQYSMLISLVYLRVNMYAASSLRMLCSRVAEPLVTLLHSRGAHGPVEP